MPWCSPRAELEAVLGPDLAVALIPLPPNQEVLWQPGAAAHAQLHASLSEDANRKKKKAGVPRTQNVETHFWPEGGRVT